MRILFLNFGYGTGLDGRMLQYSWKGWRLLHPGTGAEERLAQAVQRLSPDVIGLAEVDSGSFRTASRPQWQSLLGKGYRLAISEKKYAEHSRFRQTPLMSGNAAAILSKERLPESEAFFFSCGAKRLVLRARISEKTELFVVHLALGKETRSRQLSELSAMIRGRSAPEAIVAGDFNTLSGFAELASLLSETGLASANTSHEPTFPFFKPSKEIDFFLHTKGIIPERFETLADPISDHRGLLLDFAD